MQKPWERFDADVSSRYEIHRKIGRGCYGIVWEVKTKGEPQITLALKKILYAFRNDYDAQRTYREIMYLMEFGDHDNILTMRDLLVSSNDKHIYVITDLWESDVYKAIKCQVLNPVHKVLISYQVLRALKYIHSAKVMHRDVKPSNILLSTRCNACLCDFGWARSAPLRERHYATDMTGYASTRWYRAPEILLGSTWYTVAIDMWALACVVGELHLEGPLIMGTSTLDMLAKIEEMCGKPPPHDMEMMEAPYAGLARAAMIDQEIHVPLEGLLPGNDNEILVDFLKLILQWNPAKRLSAVEALTHPFVAPFHDPDGEPVCDHPVILPLRDHQQQPPSRYRDQLYADVLGMTRAKRHLKDQENREKEWLGSKNGAIVKAASGTESDISGRQERGDGLV